MTKVLLGLGSNKSSCGIEPLELLACACKEIKRFAGTVRFSSIYETEPMYVVEQEKFLNMAVLCTVQDTITPFSMLDFIHTVEERYGRDRSKEIRFGARPLDIDIEEFGNIKLDTPSLQIPHPRMHERQFVLLPALEILKDSADSVLRKKLLSYLKVLPEQGAVKCSVHIQERFIELLNS